MAQKSDKSITKEDNQGSPQLTGNSGCCGGICTFILKWWSMCIIAYLGLNIFNLLAQNRVEIYGLQKYLPQSLLNSHQATTHAHTLLEKIVLTEQEENDLIREYGELEYNIKASEDCAIGVGYTTCMDIGFRAADLIKKLQKDIDQLGGVEAFKEPKVYSEINDLKSFLSTFLYYFSRGANAERSTDSTDFFNYLVTTVQEEVESPITYNPEIGGHSSVWALRAQKEGCKTFIAAQSSKFNHKALHYTPEHSEKYLVWPHQAISERLSQQNIEEDIELDVHLVFEYQEGDEILGFKAPRSNRFYFVHDPNGASLKQMDVYHDIIKSHPNIKRHLFGGYQLMQKLNYDNLKERLQRQEHLWTEMRQIDPEHMIHVEFAHFSNREFFELFEQHVVRHADSLGMNEQELIMLLDLWEDKLVDINQARESKPTIEEILSQLKQFFELAKQKSLPISRVHLHPYGSFIMCYDTTKWEDAREAIIKSAMATPKFCKMTDRLQEEHLQNYDVPARPKFFKNPGKDNEVIEIQKNNLTYKFDLGENIECYLQFFLKCRSLIKTAGLGDTISSTGFIYHKPKSQN